jgi:Mg/Co/Ni transporter MgtE
MSTQTLLLRISSLVGHTDCQPCRALAQSVSPTQLGDALSQLTLAAHLSLLNQLSGRDCADSYTRLNPKRQLRLFDLMSPERRVNLLHSLSPQQRATFVGGGLMRLAHHSVFARDIALTLAELSVGVYVDLSRLKLDPAAASAPLVTSVVDVVGVLIYLGMAAYILGLPSETVSLFGP